MTSPTIARLRLQSQRIENGPTTSIKALVHWMGALQAQDFAMVRWAVGLRVPGTTEADVQQAIADGEIIRTHLLRPTWHLVAAEDIYWLLELTAPQIRKLMAARHRQLEITPELLVQTQEMMVSMLEGRKSLPREAFDEAFTQAGIGLDDNRLSHLLACAELDGLIASGAAQGNKHTFALLEERVPRPSALSREEALARLALRYFNSHGPATLADFVWWSGLPIRDARQAIAAVQSELVEETIEGQTYWFSTDLDLAVTESDSLHLLPAFDEFIISYRDRSASLPTQHHQKAVSSNGVFRPTVVHDGQVIGLWKRSVKGEKVVVEVAGFHDLEERLGQKIRQAAEGFGAFLGKAGEVSV